MGQTRNLLYASAYRGFDKFAGSEFGQRSWPRRGKLQGSSLQSHPLCCKRSESIYNTARKIATSAGSRPGPFPRKWESSGTTGRISDTLKKTAPPSLRISGDTLGSKGVNTPPQRQVQPFSSSKTRQGLKTFRISAKITCPERCQSG